MVKKFNGKDMIAFSRFTGFIDKMIPEARQDIASRIDRYISENKEYCDKRNYLHLCNIFTSMAFFTDLVRCGTKEKEAENIVFKVMHRRMKKESEKLKNLANRWYFWPFFKIMMPFLLRFKNGYGWRYSRKKKVKRNEFAFECHGCIYKQILSKYGFERFVPHFCQNDLIAFGNLPRTDFIRTKTIGRGDDFCDFKFVRYKKNVKFERTKSV